MTPSNRRLSACFAMAAAIAARPAVAQPSAADRNVAQSLFDEGKQLMEAGKYQEACPKLAESQRLDPGGGTMINLALCHESEGRLATAWSDFNEALSLARRDGRSDREAACQEHIAALLPKLPRVTFTVTAPAQGQSLRLDGSVLGPAAWGRPAPLDPGSHEVVAEAPGKKPWRSQFDLAVGERKALEIPALEDDVAAGQAGAALPAASGAPAPRDPGVDSGGAGRQRTMGFIVGGAGVAFLGVGTFFGLQALSKKSDSDDECPTDTTCTKEGVALNDEANTAAWIANAGVGLGLVGVGIGTYLILSAGPDEAPPPRSARRLWLDAGATSRGGAVTLGGAW